MRRQAKGLGILPDLPKAACKDHPRPNLWSPRRPNAMIEYQAKAICGTCPERIPCALFAIEAHPIYGIWGGTTLEERRAMLGET